jgi:hypothetical protein
MSAGIIGARIGGNGPYNAALVEPGNNRVHNSGGTNAIVTSIVSTATMHITNVVRSLSRSALVVLECNIYTSFKGTCLLFYDDLN